MASVLLGLAQPTYYFGFNPLLNWWKSGAGIQVNSSVNGTILPANGAVWTNGTYFSTTTGELVNPLPADFTSVLQVFFAAVSTREKNTGADFSGEPWIVEWDGAATVAIGGSTSGSVGYGSTGTSPKNFTMGTDPGNTWITLTSTDDNNPPTNIRVYQARYAANVAAGELFNPDWIEEISQFDTLRLMGFTPINFTGSWTAFSQFAPMSWQHWGQYGSEFGPKWGMPLDAIKELAEVTGCKLHVCFNYAMDDACVQAMAEWYRDNIVVHVTFEYANEPWNGVFSGQNTFLAAAGNAIWPADGARALKYYGYRSSQCMKIVRDAYNDATRWAAALNTQTTVASVTDHYETGFEKWKLDTSSALEVADLFAGGLYVTGYFGDAHGSTLISGITQANPGVVTCTAAPSNGADVYLRVGAGMVELNGTYATVANRTATTFELSGVNTSGFTAYAESGSSDNYLVAAKIFRMMDESNDLFIADPITYPTKYTYFNQQLAQSCLTGTSAFGYNTSVSVASLRDTYWPAQKTRADAFGIPLKQYEGGLHLVGDVWLTAHGGNTQFNEFLHATGHSDEMSYVYDAGFQAFKKLGGVLPSKFVDAGCVGTFGTWGGMRYFPTEANGDALDNQNPVWLATVRANAGKRRMKVELS